MKLQTPETKVKLLSIKQAAKLVEGLTEHRIRQLVKLLLVGLCPNPIGRFAFINGGLAKPNKNSAVNCQGHT